MGIATESGTDVAVESGIVVCKSETVTLFVGKLKLRIFKSYHLCEH